MTLEQIEKLAKLEAAATPESWFADKDKVRHSNGGSPVGTVGAVVWAGIRGYQPMEKVSNAEFIAAARNALPGLLADWQVMREAL